MSATGSNWKRGAIKTASMLLSIMLLSSCATTPKASPPTGATGRAIPCKTIERILGDDITFDAKEDTGETVRQIRIFNAIFDAACGAR